MPRKLKAGQERKISVSISIDPRKWAELDKRCQEIQIWLRHKGVTEKDASGFSRSALLRSCIEASSQKWFTGYMKAQIAPLFGVDNDQQEIEFPEK
jgi:hypothetical protein